MNFLLLNIGGVKRIFISLFVEQESKRIKSDLKVCQELCLLKIFDKTEFKNSHLKNYV